MKIALVDHSGQPGGGQLSLMRYLTSNSEHERTAVFLAGGPVADRVAEAGLCQTIVIDEAGGLFAGAHKLARTLESLAPDLVLSNSIRAGVTLSLPLFSKWRRILYVRQQIDVDSVGRPRAAAYRLVASRHDGIVANSEWTRERVARSIKVKPIAVAHPISGVSTVDPARRPEGGRVRLAVVARFQEWKGQLEALRAVQLVGRRGYGSRVELVLAGGVVFGSHDYLQACERLAASCESDVKFVGHVDDVDELLRTVDVMVHLPRMPEPFGQVVVQALARGCVVLSEGKGGAGEILRGQASAIYPRDSSPEAVADAIIALVEGMDKGIWPGVADPLMLGRYFDEGATHSLDGALTKLGSALGPV